MLTMHKDRSFHGFTMIELVMVIVIIGILAAVALPRFTNLTGQAQIAANRALAGNFRAGVNIAHTAFIAAGANTGGPASMSITIDNTAISVNYLGYPDAGQGGAFSGASYCVTIFNAVLNNPPQVVTSSGSCTDTPCYVVTNSSSGVCRWNLNGTSRNISYNWTSGSVWVS